MDARVHLVGLQLVRIDAGEGAVERRRDVVQLHSRLLRSGTTPSGRGRRSELQRGLLRKKAAAAPAPAATPERDELEEYLSAPLETDTNLDLLAYWKLKESTWPKLAKMAKQYLAAPFSSAGVERVFSAAGKMHDDLRKSEKDSTLEHSLFAAFNAD